MTFMLDSIYDYVTDDFGNLVIARDTAYLCMSVYGGVDDEWLCRAIV